MLRGGPAGEAECLIATYNNAARGSTQRAAVVDDAGDLVLESAFIGNINCFPIPPGFGSGLAGPAISRHAFGNIVHWPWINPGIDICVGIRVKPSVLHRIEPPEGYRSEDLSLIQVSASLNLFGPQER